MEEFILNEMISIARDRGCEEILGIYKPTAKNKLVAGLYERLGFEKIGEDNGAIRWRLKVGPDAERTSYVRQLEMAE